MKYKTHYDFISHVFVVVIYCYSIPFLSHSTFNMPNIHEMRNINIYFTVTQPAALQLQTIQNYVFERKKRSPNIWSTIESAREKKRRITTAKENDIMIWFKKIIAMVRFEAKKVCFGRHKRRSLFTHKKTG